MAHNSDMIFTNNIHILLVDHDEELLASTARKLRNTFYKVTTADTGLEAIFYLSHATMSFDLVLMDKNLLDVDAFTLLPEFIGKGIPTVVMSNDRGNVAVAKLAFQHGACLYLEKPISIEVLKTLWQHVMKDRIMKNIPENPQINAMEAHFEDASEMEMEVDGNNLCKSKKDGKSYAHWTQERHRKFAAAVYQLGNGNCYPKQIHELMNEPNLSRLQVASHLQKCRLKKSGDSQTNSIPESPTKKVGSRKYGKMPFLGMLPNSSRPTQSQENNEARETYTPSENFSSNSPQLGDNFSAFFFDDIPNYELPDIDYSLHFQELIGTKSFRTYQNVEKRFPSGSNFDFSYQPQCDRGV